MPGPLPRASLPRASLPRVCLLLLLLLASAPARALDLKEQVSRRYEEELVRWGLRRAGLTVDPAPAGKVVERVVVVREDIIAESDPWPGFLNWVHVKTREHVVRQEVLIRPGQVWDEDLVRETARNLRELFILGVVRLVPARSSAPGKVVLLVITKDLWSIRLNTLFSMVGSTLQFFEFNPTEQNFLGRNKQLSLHLRLQQMDLSAFSLRDSVTVGQTYVDPRIWGSRLRLVERLALRVAGSVPCGGALGGADSGGGEGVWCPSADPGDVEGVYAYALLERPLFSLATKWGFFAYGLADVEQVRFYEGGGTALRTVGRTDRVPRVYDKERYNVGAAVTRSFGRQIKHDVQGGLITYRSRYAAPEGFPFSPALRDWFLANYVPRSESAAYLTLSYRTRDTRYARLRNIKTFGLTEDFALGHDVRFELRLASELSDMRPSFVTGILESRYRWHIHDTLLTVELNARARYQPGLDEPYHRGPVANVNVHAALTAVSPVLWVGRLHLRARATVRHNDLTNTQLALGGGLGLRGYPSEALEGENVAQVNVEFRTLPLNLWTLHVGLVAFYDGGVLWGGPDPSNPAAELDLHDAHAVGLGIRGLFPQFDKETLRIDFGIPLSDGAGSVGTWFSLSFQQVF